MKYPNDHFRFMLESVEKMRVFVSVIADYRRGHPLEGEYLGLDELPEDLSGWEVEPVDGYKEAGYLKFHPVYKEGEPGYFFLTIYVVIHGDDED